MFCPKCGKENRTGSFFCISCGTPLPKEEEQDFLMMEEPIEGEEQQNAGPIYPRRDAGPLNPNRQFIKFLILNTLTLGIYGIFFMSRLVRDVNILCAEDGDYTSHYVSMVLLSLITFGVYGLIWWYKLTNRLYEVSRNHFVEVDSSFPFYCFIFRLFSLLTFGILTYVSDYYVIKVVNQLVEDYNQKTVA